MEFIKIENQVAILLNDSDIEMLATFRSPSTPLILSEPKRNPFFNFKVKTREFYEKLVKVFGYDKKIFRNNSELIELEKEFYLKDLSDYLNSYDKRNLVEIFYKENSRIDYFILKKWD